MLKITKLATYLQSDIQSQSVDISSTALILIGIASDCLVYMSTIKNTKPKCKCDMNGVMNCNS